MTPRPSFTFSLLRFTPALLLHYLTPQICPPMSPRLIRGCFPNTTRDPPTYVSVVWSQPFGTQTYHQDFFGNQHRESSCMITQHTPSSGAAIRRSSAAPGRVCGCRSSGRGVLLITGLSDYCVWTTPVLTNFPTQELSCWFCCITTSRRSLTSL